MTKRPTARLHHLSLGGHTFDAFSGGPFHTCALTPAGAAYCWGSNGALANSATDRLEHLVAVAGLGTVYICVD